MKVAHTLSLEPKHAFLLPGKMTVIRIGSKSSTSSVEMFELRSKAFSKKSQMSGLMMGLAGACAVLGLQRSRACCLTTQAFCGEPRAASFTHESLCGV